MPRRTDDPERVTVYLPRELVTRLRVEAAGTRVPLSHVCAVALEAHLERTSIERENA